MRLAICLVAVGFIGCSESVQRYQDAGADQAIDATNASDTNGADIGRDTAPPDNRADAPLPDGCSGKPIALQPGHWLEVPDSQLDVVAPPEPLSGSVAAVIGAWGGGALDTYRDRLLLWGGGHSDYAGNEIYAFNLDSLSWARIWGPTPIEQIPEGDGTWEEYLDGNPSSRHTYDGLAYLPPPHDALWTRGSSCWRLGGGAVGAWSFSFGASSWRRLADPPSSGIPRSAFDPVTRHVFHRSRYHFSEYDPDTDKFVERMRDGAGSWGNETATIDPGRRTMYLLGDCKLFAFHLESYTYEELKPTGDSEIACAKAPGFVYYPPEDRLVAWSGQPDGDPKINNEDVYVLDPDALTWTRRGPAATNTVIPTRSAKWGTNGRFQYSTCKNVFVLVNATAENVFLLSL